MGCCCGKDQPVKVPHELNQPSKIDHEEKDKIGLPDPPSSPPASHVLVFVALFDYEARTNDDLSFQKGDFLEVKEEDRTFDWWMATSRKTNQSGYIPNNYVAEVKTLEAEE